MATVEPTGRQMRADARRNYERLLATAREAFGERGVEASLDDIAKRAGVGPGTLYRHFPTREALLADVYRADVEGMVKRAEELAAKYPPEEALIEWMRAQLDYVKRKSGLGAAVKSMLGKEAEAVIFCRDNMRSALGRLLGPAQEAGIIRRDVEPAQVLRLIHGVGTASENAPDQAEKLLSIVIDGLRPPRRD